MVAPRWAGELITRTDPLVVRDVDGRYWLARCELVSQVHIGVEGKTEQSRPRNTLVPVFGPCETPREAGLAYRL